MHIILGSNCPRPYDASTFSYFQKIIYDCRWSKIVEVVSYRYDIYTAERSGLVNRDHEAFCLRYQGRAHHQIPQICRCIQFF